MEDLLKRGIKLFSCGKVEEAENFFLNFLKEYPANVEVLNNLGVIRCIRGNVDEGRAFFEKALENKNDHLDSLQNLVKINLKETKQVTLNFSMPVLKPSFINIGGGPDFSAERWLNLEEVQSNFNPQPFKLIPDCEFPVEKGSAEVVYSSHCFEHLNTPTVIRIFSESYRILNKYGRFIIKLPDFDEALNRWKRRDVSYFDDRWDYKSVVWTWQSRQVPDSLDFRAAMLFCGFWNDEYGNHFGKQISQNKSAYHGPPVVEYGFLQNLMENYTPRQISAKLRQVVLEDEKNFSFNHQNAWSHQELEVLLVQMGFKVISFDKEFIIDNNQCIPEINHMRQISMYCWAEKDRILC
jgi:tetratricopeptide (TPR) repeat protein